MQRLVFTSLPYADIVVSWPDFWVGLKVSAQKISIKISLMIRGSITIAFFVGTRIPQFQKHPNLMEIPHFLMVKNPICHRGGKLQPLFIARGASRGILPHESVEKLDVGSRDQRFSQKRVQMEFLEMVALGVGWCFSWEVWYLVSMRFPKVGYPKSSSHGWPFYSCFGLAYGDDWGSPILHQNS